MTGALNIQISKALSIPFLFELAKFPLSLRNLSVLPSIFCLLFILCPRRRPWLGDRESFTCLILLVYKEEQREDRPGPRWTVCNVVSYS